MRDDLRHLVTESCVAAASFRFARDDHARRSGVARLLCTPSLTQLGANTSISQTRRALDHSLSRRRNSFFPTSQALP
jgi:hypothetical protein